MGVDEIPVVICRGTRVLKKPTIEEVGECLGLNRFDTSTVHDAVVVGAGPSRGPPCGSHASSGSVCIQLVHRVLAE